MDGESNPFIAPSDLSNVALIVEGKKIHVNKEYLAIQSSVFARIFFGELAKKGPEVEIKHVAYEEFVELMKVIHPRNSPIPATSVSVFLKLVDRFNMEGGLELLKLFLNASDIKEEDKSELLAEIRIKQQKFNSMRRYMNELAPPPPPHNHFSAPTQFSNVILIVEGRKLHVSKEYLATHSPVFAVTFFGGFSEKGKKEVEIKDIVYEEFVDLLNVIYPGISPLTATSISHILNLADRFQCMDAISQTEAFLMTSTDVEVATKLCLSEQYNLQKLKDRCLKSFKCVFSMHNIKSSTDYANLSDAVKLAIYDRMMELISPSFSSSSHSTECPCWKC